MLLTLDKIEESADGQMLIISEERVARVLKVSEVANKFTNDTRWTQDINIHLNGKFPFGQIVYHYHHVTDQKYNQKKSRYPTRDTKKISNLSESPHSHEPIML